MSEAESHVLFTILHAHAGSIFFHLNLKAAFEMQHLSKQGSLAKSDLGNLSPALFDLELSQHGQRNVPGIGYQLQIAQDTPKEFLRSITALCRPSGELESKVHRAYTLEPGSLSFGESLGTARAWLSFFGSMACYIPLKWPALLFIHCI